MPHPGNTRKRLLLKNYFSKYLEDSMLGNFKKDYKHKYLHFCLWNTDTLHLCLIYPN